MKSTKQPVIKIINVENEEEQFILNVPSFKLMIHNNTQQEKTEDGTISHKVGSTYTYLKIKSDRFTSMPIPCESVSFENSENLVDTTNMETISIKLATKDFYSTKILAEDLYKEKLSVLDRLKSLFSKVKFSYT